MSEAGDEDDEKNVLQRPRENCLVRILKPWNINLWLLESNGYALITYAALFFSFIAEAFLFLQYSQCKLSQPKTCPEELTSKSWLCSQMITWIGAKSLSLISILLLLNYLNVEIEIIGKRKAREKIYFFLFLSYLFFFSLVKWIYWSSLVIAVLQAANIIAVIYGTIYCVTTRQSIIESLSRERKRYDSAFKLSEWKKEDLAPIYDYQILNDPGPTSYDLRPVGIEDKLYLMKPMTLTANDKDWIKEMLVWENYNFLRFEAFVVEFIELPYLEIAFEIQGILMELPENGNIYSKINHLTEKDHTDIDFLKKAFQPLQSTEEEEKNKQLTNCSPSVGLIWISQLANALEYCHVLDVRPVIKTDRLFLTDNYCKLAIEVFERNDESRRNMEAGDIKIELINDFVNVVEETHEKLEAAKNEIIQQLVKSEENANKSTEERIAREVKERISREVEERITREVEERITREVEERISREVEERISREVEESLNFLKDIIQKLTEQNVDKSLEIFDISAYLEAKIYNIQIREKNKEAEKTEDLKFVKNRISGSTKSLIREKKAVLEIEDKNIRKFLSFVYDSNPLKIEGYYFERFSRFTLKNIIGDYSSKGEDKKDRFNKYLLLIANQIRDAILACHKKNIIHRNICSDAILIHEEIYESDKLHETPIVKLKDFSSARIAGKLMTARPETEAYCAPEMIDTDGGKYVHYDCKVDYWSYAFVLYALVKKEEPTNIHKKARINHLLIDKKLYESLREAKADVLIKRMKSCWDKDPKKRNIEINQ